MWSHTKCVGVDNDQHQEMVNSDKFSWCCPSCVLPFSNESVLDSAVIDHSSTANAVNDESNATLYMVSDLLGTKSTNL